MDCKILETERLVLRKVISADADFVLQGLSDPAVTKYMVIHYKDHEEVQVQMNYYNSHYLHATGYYWMMETKSSQEKVGVIGINHVSHVHHRCELGFWSVPVMWGKGYITEAAKAVVQFAFEELHINRIQATVETDNPASIAVLKKLGFTHEGTLREYEMNKGSYIDLMYFALLRREVQEVQKV